jgi:hypothetical protein
MSTLEEGAGWFACHPPPPSPPQLPAMKLLHQIWFIPAYYCLLQPNTAHYGFGIWITADYLSLISSSDDYYRLQLITTVVLDYGSITTIYLQNQLIYWYFHDTGYVLLHWERIHFYIVATHLLQIKFHYIDFYELLR